MADPTVQDLQKQLNALQADYVNYKKTQQIQNLGNNSAIQGPLGGNAFSQLYTGQIFVGGGDSTSPQEHATANISVFDVASNLIGWIGNALVGGLYWVGAWFKVLYVGGTDVTNAPFVADSSGNITVTQGNFTMTGGTFSLDSGTVTAIIDMNRPIGGGTATGVGVFLDAHPTRTTTISTGFAVAFNDAGARTWNMGFSGAGPNQKGFLQVYDGTGAGGLSGAGERIQMDGGQGHIILLGPGSGNPALLELKDSTSITDIILQNVVAATASNGAVAVPALCNQFWVISVNGTSYKIPLFNV